MRRPPTPFGSRNISNSSSAWPPGAFKTDFAPTTWQAFWQTAVEGESGAAVAAELGLSVGAVYVARSRVLARLTEQIQQSANGVTRPSEVFVMSVPSHLSAREPLAASCSPGRRATDHEELVAPPRPLRRLPAHAGEADGRDARPSWRPPARPAGTPTRTSLPCGACWTISASDAHCDDVPPSRKRGRPCGAMAAAAGGFPRSAGPARRL